MYMKTIFGYFFKQENIDEIIYLFKQVLLQ